MTLLPESVPMVELAASYAAGKWVSGAHAGTLDVTSPATGELLGTVGIAAPTTWALRSPRPRRAAVVGGGSLLPIAVPHWGDSPTR